MTTVQCRWEIEVSSEHSLGGTGTAHSFNAVDRSLFVHLPTGAGYLKLGVDPVRLVGIDPKRNSDMSRAVFNELMILQKHGWPEDEDAALEAEKASLASQGGNANGTSGEGANGLSDENVAAAALRALSSSSNGDSISASGNDSEPLEKLHPGQLVRAALRPGGHFYNGRITSTNEDGSMCGVAFFDGDKVDALPRSLIVPAPSPSKMRKRLEIEQGLEKATNDEEAEQADSTPEKQKSNREDRSDAENVDSRNITALPPPPRSKHTPSNKNKHQSLVSAPLPPRPASPAISDSSDDFEPAEEILSRPSTRRGRDEALNQMRKGKPNARRPASARRARPNAVPPSVSAVASNAETSGSAGSEQEASHVNFTDVSASASSRAQLMRNKAAPIVAADTSALQAQLPSNYPTRADFERQYAELRKQQKPKSRRKRPKSANPRGRNLRVKESFIERNKRLVSEMSRKIVRPEPPPPPPSEPDEDLSRRRQNQNKNSKNDNKPEWKSTSRIWLNATGQGMSLWSEKVQALASAGANRHSGPIALTLNSNRSGKKGTDAVPMPIASLTSPIRKNRKKITASRAELIASQEMNKYSELVREGHKKGEDSKASKKRAFEVTMRDVLTQLDAPNAAFLLASRHRWWQYRKYPLKSIDTSKPRSKWKKGGLGAEGLRILSQAKSSGALNDNAKKGPFVDSGALAGSKQKDAKAQKWAMIRAAEQRVALASMILLEKDLKKILSARDDLQIEIQQIQQKLDGSKSENSSNFPLSPTRNVTGKDFAKNPSDGNTLKASTTSSVNNSNSVRPMTVDEEVALLVRRSKMAVLRAAMTGQGEAGESVESIDFDRYAIQLVMLLRKLRKSLMTQSQKSTRKVSNDASAPYSSAFHWRWEDLEVDLRAAAREEQRSLKKAQESRKKQRLRRAALQQHYQDGSAGNPSGSTAKESTDNHESDGISVVIGGTRPNVSGPTLLRSLRIHTGLDLSEHEQALVLTHFEYNSATASGNNGEIMRVDVEEFMDAMRPPLNFRRQRIVDSMFARFRESKEGLRIQEWSHEVHRQRGKTEHNSQTELISGTEVWAAYCAFRTLTPSGHRRGHVALEALDLWLRPVPEKQARRWLQQETRKKKNGSGPPSMLPAVARQPLRREQWDALHRSLGARIPDDSMFERCVRAAWVFAGEANLSEVVSQERNDVDLMYDDGFRSEEGPFGVSLDSVNAFVTEIPPIVDASGKEWVKFGDMSSAGGSNGVNQDANNPYWYCRATGERTWKRPHSVVAAERSAELSSALARKLSALSDLKTVENQLRMDIESWCQQLQKQGLGLSGDDDDVASSGCLALRGLSISHIPDMFLGEGGTFLPGLEGRVTVGPGGMDSVTTSPITHLWLDGNPFGDTEAGVFEGLSSIMSRVSSTVEEISLCSCNLGNGEGKAASPRLLNEALFAAKDVRFQRLLVLRLRGNKLRMFSPRVTQASLPCFEKLADLDLSSNKLSSVPASLFTACPNLTHLSLAGNEIKDIPSDGREKQGQNSPYAKWPAHLVSLDLSSNRLKCLPTSMGGSAHSLTYLDVSKNSIQSVPASLFEPKHERPFSSLRVFLLHHNALSGDDALPQALPTALSDSCRRLNLSHNSITALPSDIGSMQALRELFVNHNELAAFPSGIGSGNSESELMLPNVTSIRLENNRISVLPPRFGKFVSLSTRLQHLSLQNNRLVALPELVPRPTKGQNKGKFVPGLLTLDASHNRIVQLPRSIGEAVGSSLMQLRLAHNRIEALPVSSFARLRKLQDLTLHGNPLLSTELREVVSTGSYTPPLARQVASVVRKIFDAIKDNWGEVDTRVHTAVTKLRRNLAKKGRSTKQKPGSVDAAPNVGGAMQATEEGSALANTTDELLGSKRLFRSLNVTYQRLQSCLKKFDSSGGAHGGRLDAVEFRTAVEAVGMYLTDAECDFLTAFALEACSPRVNNDSRRTTSNTGCIGIREFIAEVLRPGSTSSSSSEGVAQAVVSYCVDLAGRKSRILNSHGYVGGSAKGYASSQTGFESVSGRGSSKTQGDFQIANREMRAQLRTLQKKQKQWESKAAEAEQFVEGKGPRPKWMRDTASKTKSSGAVSESKEFLNHSMRDREDTVFRAKITHEKLRQKKRLLQQKIRQEAARARRLEIKAATDPTLTKIAYKEPGLTREAEKALERATDNPVGTSGERFRSDRTREGNREKHGTGHLPPKHKQLRALIASIRGGIEMDERFANIKDNKEKASTFFDYLKEVERSQGLVLTNRKSQDKDSVAGGTIISGIRQLRPVPVLLPPEQCPDLLELLGCPAEKQVGGRVTRSRFLEVVARRDPVDKNGINAARRKRMLREKKLKEKKAARDARTAKGQPPKMKTNPQKATNSKKPGRGPFTVKVFFIGSGRGLPPSELIVTASDSVSAIQQKLEFQHGIPSERMHLFINQRRVNVEAAAGKNKAITAGSIGLHPNSELQVAIE